MEVSVKGRVLVERKSYCSFKLLLIQSALFRTFFVKHTRTDAYNYGICAWLNERNGLLLLYFLYFCFIKL